MGQTAQHELGAQGEHLAAEFLKSKGYHIIVTNLRGRFTELDILCERGELLVAVEVRTRSSSNPVLSVTPEKVRRLRRSLHHLAARYPNRDIRLDLIAIYWSQNHSPVITHLEQLI